MSWIDPQFPRTATLTGLVGRVLGLNPGMMTGPGTNTYLIGRRDPILLDTGAGVDDYVPLFGHYLDERGWSQPSRWSSPTVIATTWAACRSCASTTAACAWPRWSIATRAAGKRGEPGRRRTHRGRWRDAGRHPHPRPRLRPPLLLPGEEKAVFTGDVVLGGSTTVIPAEDGDLLDYLNSLKRLQSLDVQRIYPAHGPVIEDAQGKLTEYIEHRMLRERQILQALGDGLRTIPTMVERIYAEVPKNLHAMAGQSVASHLKKLAREGRVREHVEPNAPSRWELVG